MIRFITIFIILAVGWQNWLRQLDAKGQALIFLNNRLILLCMKTLDRLQFVHE